MRETDPVADIVRHIDAGSSRPPGRGTTQVDLLIQVRSSDAQAIALLVERLARIARETASSPLSGTVSVSSPMTLGGGASDGTSSEEGELHLRGAFTSLSSTAAGEPSMPVTEVEEVASADGTEPVDPLPPWIPPDDLPDFAPIQISETDATPPDDWDVGAIQAPKGPRRLEQDEYESLFAFRSESESGASTPDAAAGSGGVFFGGASRDTAASTEAPAPETLRHPAPRPQSTRHRGHSSSRAAADVPRITVAELMEEASRWMREAQARFQKFAEKHFPEPIIAAQWPAVAVIGCLLMVLAALAVPAISRVARAVDRGAPPAAGFSAAQAGASVFGDDSLRSGPAPGGDGVSGIASAAAKPESSDPSGYNSAALEAFAAEAAAQLGLPAIEPDDAVQPPARAAKSTRTQRSRASKTTTASTTASSSSPRSANGTPQRRSVAATSSSATPSSSARPPSPANTFVGTLEVTSSPPGASVAVNNRIVGTTPVTLADWPAGTHAIRIELPGFERWGRAVLVGAGKRARANASLRKLGASDH